jgi:hypothetical protein
VKIADAPVGASLDTRGMKRVLLVLVATSTLPCLPSAAGAAGPIKASEHARVHVGRLAGGASALATVARAPRPTERLSPEPAVVRSTPRPVRFSTIVRRLRQGDVGLALTLTDRLVRRILALGRAWLADAADEHDRDV